MRATCLAIATALLCAPAAAQTLYKCVQSTGRTVYQDSPCDDAAKQSTVRTPDAAGTPAPPPGEKDAPADIGVNGIVETMSTYHGCGQEVVGFTAKHKVAYDEWRLRNAAAMQKYNRDEKAQQRVRDSMQQQLQSAPQDEKGREERSESCDRAVAPLLGGGKPRT